MMMQTVDRAGFMSWLDGICLHFEKGTGFAVPEMECIEAENALRRNEKVALTVKGKIVSILERREDGIYEVKA